MLVTESRMSGLEMFDRLIQSGKLEKNKWNDKKIKKGNNEIFFTLVQKVEGGYGGGLLPL